MATEVNELLNLLDIRQYTTWLLEQDQAGVDDFWTEDIVNGFITAEHTKLVTQINQSYEEFFTEIATTDIVADQEMYQLPTDGRTLNRLEYSGNPGTVQWTPIEPKQVMEIDKFWVNGGVQPLNANITRRIVYHFIAGSFRIVPFFNAAVTGGLRLWYTKRVLGPQSAVENGDYSDFDSWVPFNGLLTDHHELLAIGAAIRGKTREEIPFTGLAMQYNELYRLLTLDIEQRQVQRTKTTREVEGYYDEGF
jgi:hypothetical protein